MKNDSSYLNTLASNEGCECRGWREKQRHTERAVTFYAVTLVSKAFDYYFQPAPTHSPLSYL